MKLFIVSAILLIVAIIILIVQSNRNKKQKKEAYLTSCAFGSSGSAKLGSNYCDRNASSYPLTMPMPNDPHPQQTFKSKPYGGYGCTSCARRTAPSNFPPSG